MQAKQKEAEYRENQIGIDFVPCPPDDRTPSPHLEIRVFLSGEILSAENFTNSEMCVDVYIVLSPTSSCCLRGGRRRFLSRSVLWTCPKRNESSTIACTLVFSKRIDDANCFTRIGEGWGRRSHKSLLFLLSFWSATHCQIASSLAAMASTAFLGILAGQLG